MRAAEVDSRGWALLCCTRPRLEEGYQAGLVQYVQYVRKTKLRHICIKNGDTHVSHYKVIQDVRSGTSPIRIHLRRALVRACLILEINLKRARRARVTDLITGWGHCDTNRRRAKGHTSLITKKSKTCFNLTRRQFDCWLGPLWH
jgi:hypothetical protein